MPLTVGTAGHIDHGKTWLVRALTGKDTDRLPEEQERGISIDLGYAPLELPDGRRLSVVDVPGHERFVRNMVAGATGIDLFLLVVDAGEGARPQTHEHLAILRLLDIDTGVVAVTKADAVERELVELVVEEARELVPGAEVVAVSAKTGEGLDELRAALAAAAGRVQPRTVEAPTRLFVDRSFTLRGIGTVVTGTLWSGSIGGGDDLRVEPGGRDVRVRSVQVHDRAVERAEAGQRVAVALPGVARDQIHRGDALVAAGAYAPSFRLDVELDAAGDLPDVVRVHHGTGEHVARAVRAEDGLAQLRLRTPAVAARGDRFVLRAGTTVGGGTVLDPAPPRRVDAERLRLLREGDPETVVRAIVHEPVTRDELAARGLLAAGELDRALSALERAGDLYFAREWLDEVRARLDTLLADRAGELDPGVAVAEALPAAWAPAIVPLLGLERRGSKLYRPGARASLGARETEAAAVEAALADGAVVKVADRELARFLEAEGRLVRLGDGFAISTDAYARARDALVAECESAGRITLARFRDLVGTGRRDAQLLLERFDADGLTRRVGDERVLRRRATIES
jgi:selenocysteine-specific elongation factor